MKRSLIAVVVLLGSGLAFAQGSAKGSAGKETGSEATVPAQEKKKAEPARPQPPNVSQMPFTPDSIREVMTYYSRDIQECYEEILATKGSKVEEGRIMTSFTITPDGFVRNAKVVKAGTTAEERTAERVRGERALQHHVPAAAGRARVPHRVSVQPQGHQVGRPPVNLELTETQTLIRDTARKFARERMAPQARRFDKRGDLPHGALQGAGRPGAAWG